jgi:hypothetical protein
VRVAWERKYMSFSSVQKTSLLVVFLAIIGAGAFVNFDPLDLDLLGLKQKPVAAKSAAPKHVVASAQRPNPASPKSAAAATIASPVPPRAPEHASAAMSPAPKAAVAPTRAEAPADAARSMPSPTTAPAAASPAAAPQVAVQAPQPTMKLSPMKLADETKKEAKTARKPAPVKPVRPKNLDLRHCLDLEDNAAIAKCAGE